MPITDWPLDERPREKLLLRGAHALSDAELLAIFLRTGIAGKTAVDMARDLLTQFGSLGALLAADPQQFCSAPGLGPAKYAQLQAVLEMGQRYLSERISRGDALSSVEDSKRYLVSRLRGQKQEVFCCLYLDNRHRVLGFEELFHGTINGAAVYPREVLRRVMAHNAAAVILAHNHPSGVAEPSQADESLTTRLKAALDLIDVRVLDHIIVGEGDPVSFAERGLL